MHAIPSIEADDTQRRAWRPIDAGEDFPSLIGPILERTDGAPGHYALATDDRHRNRFGLVHGGVLMTLVDRAFGAIAARALKDAVMATVQHNHQFMRRVNVGDLVEARCEVVRTTKSLMFLSCSLLVRSEVVGTASAVFSYRDTSANRITSPERPDDHARE